MRLAISKLLGLFGNKTFMKLNITKYFIRTQPLAGLFYLEKYTGPKGNQAIAFSQLVDKLAKQQFYLIFSEGACC